MIIFRKVENKFYQKIAKAGVMKTLMTSPLTLETMRQLNIETWRRSIGHWCRKKDRKVRNIQKKLETIANIFKNS